MICGWNTSGRDGHYDSEVRYFILGGGCDCSICKENLQGSNAADVRKHTFKSVGCPWLKTDRFNGPN